MRGPGRADYDCYQQSQWRRQNGGGCEESEGACGATSRVMRTKLAPLLPVYLVIFVAFIGYSMMVNFFVPLIINDHGFLPPDASTGARTTTVGLLLAAYPVGQFFGSPVLGALSDRYGRKPVLLASLATAVICYGLVAYAVQERQLGLLAVACLIGGLCESNIAIAQSAVADVASPEDRGRLFAYIYSACSVGYIAGPLGGGQIAELAGFSTPFWMVAALLVLTLAWVALAFRETHQGDRSRKLDYGATFSGLATVFTDRPIRRVYFINFIFYLTLFGYFRIVLVYMIDTWHMIASESAMHYSYCAFVSLIASMVLTAPLLRRFGAKRLATGSAILSGLGMIAITFPSAEGALWFTIGPVALVGTLVLTSCATLLSGMVGGERQGRVMGNNQALQVGGEAIGAVLGGLIAAEFVSLPLIAFGVMLAGAGLLLTTVRTPNAA